jgi:DNA-binding transcriptional regulator GbsR (MarR family)
MAKNEAALRTVVEQSAAILTAAGFPRMPARVLMSLLVSEKGSYTAVELADILGVSAAAVSGAVRYLQTLGIVHRVSEPGSRRDRYSLPDQAWYAIMTRSSPMYTSLATLAEAAVAAMDDPKSQASLRTQDMADFYRFLSTRVPALLDEWEEIRDA